MVIVQLTMTRNRSQLIQEWGPDAAEIAKIAGMRWKFWAFDEAKGAYAGVYLFDSMPAAREFLAGPMLQGVRDDPKVRDVRANAYEVLADLSRVTKAPLA